MIRGRRRSVRGVVILLSVMGAVLLPVHGIGQGSQRDPSMNPTADTAAATGAQGASPTAAEVAGVLPMSMRPFYPVCAAFGLAWLLILAYAISVRRRLAALEAEVDRLGR